MTGAGMKPTRPVASTRNDGSNPETGRPSVKRRATPRAMLTVPGVTRNGDDPPHLASAPLQRPQSNPTASDTDSGTARDRPAWSDAPRTTPDRTTHNPIDD